MSRQCDYIWKILFVGNSGVGKSSVMLRFINEEFKEDVSATIGVDFKLKYLKIGDVVHKLALWDTAGQERFRGLTSSYYKGANGVIVMYDVTDRKSFNEVDSWIQEVKNNCSCTPIFCIVGNKIDKRINNESNVNSVRIEEGKQLAMKHNCMFLETSARTNEGIEFLFKELANKLVSLQIKKQEKKTNYVHLESEEEKNFSLCPC